MFSRHKNGFDATTMAHISSWEETNNNTEGNKWIHKAPAAEPRSRSKKKRQEEEITLEECRRACDKGNMVWVDWRHDKSDKKEWS